MREEKKKTTSSYCIRLCLSLCDCGGPAATAATPGDSGDVCCAVSFLVRNVLNTAIFLLVDREQRAFLCARARVCACVCVDIVCTCVCEKVMRVHVCACACV